MRLNKFVALSTGLSRRAADDAIAAGKVLVNGEPATLGQHTSQGDTVSYNGKDLVPPAQTRTIMLNKPTAYVCSRDGQGSKTIYDLLPAEYHDLKPVGRLDKDSSGLLLLTNDGTLAYELTHPSFQKEKQYEITLDHALSDIDLGTVTKQGAQLDDGPSKLGLAPIGSDHTTWRVTMAEGRNRQIRRTFESMGYEVIQLHRTHFGPYALDDLHSGDTREVLHPA